jgi:hypothetical protein
METPDLSAKFPGDRIVKPECGITATAAMASLRMVQTITAASR